jgi:hypothetical protein
MAGPKYSDKLLSSDVRRLALKEVRDVLTGDKDYGLEFKKALILKLSGNILPRLNEHTGDEGGPMIFQITKEIAEKNGVSSTSSAETDSDRQA